MLRWKGVSLQQVTKAPLQRRQQIKCHRSQGDTLQWNYHQLFSFFSHFLFKCCTDGPDLMNMYVIHTLNRLFISYISPSLKISIALKYPSSDFGPDWRIDVSAAYWLRRPPVTSPRLPHLESLKIKTILSFFFDLWHQHVLLIFSLLSSSLSPESLNSDIPQPYYCIYI